MPSTSEALIQSLRRQPLLVVLRADQPRRLQPQIARLSHLGVRHIEIAWAAHPAWVGDVIGLREAYPGLCIGAASVVCEQALAAVLEAGLSFAVSPVLDAALVAEAARHRITLVPGVFSPTEVHQARAVGCPLIKLFPAATLGPGYWRRLEAPLGALPFCIAAGGLGPADLSTWLSCGVDAVAIGGSLSTEKAWQQLAQWLPAPSG